MIAVDAPPILSGDLQDAMTQVYWNGEKERLSSRVFYYWVRKMYPIEDEL